MNKVNLKSEDSDSKTLPPQDEYYCDKCDAPMTLNDSFCPACGSDADEEITPTLLNMAQIQENNIKDTTKNIKPERTFGSILSMAIGASIGLAVMKAMGFGGGIPGGLFALGGAILGEVIYKAVFTNVK